MRRRRHVYFCNFDNSNKQTHTHTQSVRHSLSVSTTPSLIQPPLLLASKGFKRQAVDLTSAVPIDWLIDWLIERGAMVRLVPCGAREYKQAAIDG
jgi:hypothetical protein